MNRLLSVILGLFVIATLSLNAQVNDVASESEIAANISDETDTDDEYGVILTEEDLECGVSNDFQIGGCGYRFRHGTSNDDLDNQEKLKFEYWATKLPCIARCVMQEGKHMGLKSDMPQAMKSCQQECICGSSENSNKHMYRNNTHMKRR